MLVPLIFAVSLWTFAYKYLVKLNYNLQIVFSLLSMVHWLLAFIYFEIIVSFNLDHDVKYKIFGNDLTEVQLYFHVLTCSFFGFDLVARQIKNQLNSWLLIHHGLTLFFILIAVLHNQSGSENIYVLRYATFCNVPMNVKNILRVLQQKESPLYHISNILYALIYSFNFLIMLPLCLVSFIYRKTSILTISMLVLLCTQAFYTILKTHIPQFRLSVQHFKSLQNVGNSAT
ncbi:transmembrane protein, putative (macronuclear) [Tetrahymena thermophila SB210]|uniref:Transmembrane protein, putative n=1 Tax=Tetrahymena thermophila (strain SB210) TaxID=312017 RepID=W7X088_TETTS|nr:transmembrane protein, putative [Tetrahymena thermophila SB210]EWS72520.1 transmembrane protein, putative [Tetrahymena thermophila SB210]|eukprot:XP_012654956.1 transmembrane protein, putative [Tetrahymena thermophila SB210]